jgi:hypothetical protein
VDRLTFIIEMAKALGWPLALVVVVVLLRRSLVKLIPTLRHLKYGGFEADFGEKLDEAEQKADAAHLPAAEPPAALDADAVTKALPEPRAIRSAWTSFSLSTPAWRSACTCTSRRRMTTASRSRTSSPSRKRSGSRRPLPRLSSTLAPALKQLAGELEVSMRDGSMERSGGRSPLLVPCVPPRKRRARQIRRYLGLNLSNQGPTD